jgi:ApaG protein
MITNARGELTEVKGPGVVGEQPVLTPGERFEYTSGVPLNTPSGMMAGLTRWKVRAVSVLILRYRRSRWIVRVRA